MLYKVMAVPVLSYGSTFYTISTIPGSEMKFRSDVKRCTKLDHARNEDVRRLLKLLDTNDTCRLKTVNSKEKNIQKDYRNLDLLNK